MRVWNTLHSESSRRARRNSSAAAAPALLPRVGLLAKPRVAVGSTYTGVRFERSDRAAAAARVRGRGRQASPLSLKRIRRQAAALITERAKALATNALDAVGQPQTHSTPSGQLHKLTKQEGSLGE